FHIRMAVAGLSFAAEPTITIINYCRSKSMSASNQAKCAQAAYHVMRKAAESLEGRYSTDIARKLWGIAGVAGSYLDWETADSCVRLAVTLNGKTSDALSPGFQLICQLNPFLAIRLRETMIRLWKPQLRSLS
ncbi:hypothetical protein IQ225_06165, partial [Synechocystis salina LEGE 06155]|nr:hypothetical protein [Synechocystis salina LEGE 06155]